MKFGNSTTLTIMSRIGKKPIKIPAGVEVKIQARVVFVKGPKGELKREIRPEIKVVQENDQLLVAPQKETKQTAALWGLTRALLANDLKGVTEGFEKKLELEGVGYRANFSHTNLFSKNDQYGAYGILMFLEEHNSTSSRQCRCMVSVRLVGCRPIFRPHRLTFPRKRFWLS